MFYDLDELLHKNPFSLTLDEMAFLGCMEEMDRQEREDEERARREGRFN